MPNNSLLRNLNRTRRSVVSTIRKNIPSLNQVKKIIKNTPLNPKQLNKAFQNLGLAGGSRTRKQRRRRMTRRRR